MLRCDDIAAVSHRRMRAPTLRLGCTVKYKPPVSYASRHKPNGPKPESICSSSSCVPPKRSLIRSGSSDSGTLVDRCPLRRLIELRVGVHPFHIRGFAAEGGGHADHVDGHFEFAAGVDGRVECFDVVARLIGERDNHDVSSRSGEPMVPKLFCHVAHGLKHILAAGRLRVRRSRRGRRL